MFTKKVTNGDNFIALSSTAQALYLHLCMNSDDDGFCNQVSLSMFKAHAGDEDLQALADKQFIYKFNDSDVIAIKHWRMANSLRKDRYTPTVYQEQLSLFETKNDGSYAWLPNGCQMVANWLPQVSRGKGSLEEGSLVEGSSITAATTTNNETVENSVGNCEDDTDIEPPDYDVLKPIGGLGKNVVVLSDRQIDTLLEIIIDTDIFNSYVEKLATFIISKSANVKNHYKMILKWYKEDSSVSN